MAALQTLRNKPALLMSIIGGALLLFIVTLVIDGNPLGAPNVEGTVNGKKLTYEDYHKLIENEQNVYALFSPQGLSEQQKARIEQNVWENFKSNRIIETEAEEFGLKVTEDDVRNALDNVSQQQLYGLMNALQNNQVDLQQVAAAQKIILLVAQNGMQPNMAGYKQFLTQLDQQLKQIKQNINQPGMAELQEQFVSVKNACLYLESCIPGDLLRQKYFMLAQVGLLANPVSGKMDYNDNLTSYSIDLAYVPSSSVEDKAVSVTDEDLKAKYEELKPLFRNNQPSRDLKMINVTVRPSAKDNDNLRAQLETIADSLRNADTAEKVMKVMKGTRTELPYQNVYLAKEFYTENNFYEVASAIDTMRPGMVVMPTMGAPDRDGVRHITTFKLVDTKITADSIQVASLFMPTRSLADSAYADLKAGMSYAELTKNYAKRAGLPEGYKADSSWMPMSMYVDNVHANDSTAKHLYSHVSQLQKGESGVVEQVNPENGTPFYVVATVIDTKGSSTKYNVAVAQYPVKFSDETYNNEMRRLNEFLAKNKTIKDIEANAAKAGYTVTSMPATTAEVAMNQYFNMGGEATKQAFKWAFDEAEAGQVSPEIYKCGTNTDHLVVIAVEHVNDGDYREWNAPSVKEQLNTLVMQDKKSAKIMEQLKNVKTYEQAKAAKGAIAQSFPSTNLSNQDASLAGAVQRIGKGKFTGPIKTSYGVMMAQVNGVTPPAEAFNFANLLPGLIQKNASSIFGGQSNIFSSMVNAADVEDLRYRF